MKNYKGKRKGRVIRSTAIAITPFLIATVISGNWVLQTFQDDIRSIVLNRKMDDFVIEQPLEEKKDNQTVVIQLPESGEKVEVTITPTTEEPEEEEPEEKPYERVSTELYDTDYEIPTIDFDSLNQVNPDVQGWIRIDGTKINFPLLQGEDNQYYLKHDIENNSNINGAIFLDYRSNDLDHEMSELSDVSYVYGHHMKSGQMFAPLCNFKDQTYFNEHPFGLLITESGDVYKLDFFAGMVISGKDDSVLYTADFADEEEFETYYDGVRERAMVSRDIDLQLGDKVFALITCSYETTNSRFVLYARMTKQLEKIEEINETRSNTLNYNFNN